MTAGSAYHRQPEHNILNWKRKLLTVVRQNIKNTRTRIAVPVDLNVDSDDGLMWWVTTDYFQKAYEKLHPTKSFQYSKNLEKPKPKNRFLDLDKPNISEVMHKVVEHGLKRLATDGFLISELVSKLLEEAKAAKPAKTQRKPRLPTASASVGGLQVEPDDAGVIFQRKPLTQDEIEMFAGYRFDVYKMAFNQEGFFAREVLIFDKHCNERNGIPVKWHLRVHNSVVHGDGTLGDRLFDVDGLAVKVDDDVFILAQYEQEFEGKTYIRKRRFLVETEAFESKNNDARWGVIFSRVPPTAKDEHKINHPVWNKTCMLRIRKYPSMDLPSEESHQVRMSKTLEGICPNVEAEKYPYKAEILERIFTALRKNDGKFAGSLFFSGNEDKCIGIANDENRLSWPED